MSDSITATRPPKIPDGIRLSVTLPHASLLPHELAASLQDRFTMIASIIDANIQLGSASNALDVAVWLADYAHGGVVALSSAISGGCLDVALDGLLIDSERLNKLIGLSYPLSGDDSDDALNMAIELSGEANRKAGSICTVLCQWLDSEVAA